MWDTDYARRAPQVRLRTSSMSSSLSSQSMSDNIDVPAVQNARKRRPSNLSDDIMDDCMAAMVLMSLSCSPKSPRLPDGKQSECRRIVYRCTWPGCGHQCNHCHSIEKHVRTHIGRADGECSDHEEEFYYTEIEMDESSDWTLSTSSVSSMSSTCGSHSASPASLSESPSGSPSASPSASNDGSTMFGSQSQSPIPSPLAFFASSSAPTWSHLEDHVYQKPLEDVDNKRTATLVMEKNAVNVNLNHMNHMNHMHHNLNQIRHHKSLLSSPLSNPVPSLSNSLSSPLSNPINIPGISFAHQYAKSAPSVHSTRANNKYMRLNSNNKSGTTILQSPTKNSPKRGRGESRKCRKVYGMDSRDQWCTQCKWKKACSRFTD